MRGRAGHRHHWVTHPLGLWDGWTEKATVATTPRAHLVQRGLDVEQGVL